MKTTMTRALAALAALGVMLAAALTLAGGAAAAPSSTYPPPPPSGGTGGVHISNPHPHAGSTVVVHGSGCTVGALVTVFFDSQEVATGHVNPAGRYNIPFKVPGNAASGHHTVSVQVTGGSCPGSGVLGIEVVASNGGGGNGGGGGNLAGTGVAVVGIGALGVVLLVGGGMMLLAGRRRNSNHA
jgi:hypothetical protein